MPIKADTTANRFKDAFDKADKQFNKEFKLDIEAMKKASRNAAMETDKKLGIYNLMKKLGVYD